MALDDPQYRCIARRLFAKSRSPRRPPWCYAVVFEAKYFVRDSSSAAGSYSAMWKVLRRVPDDHGKRTRRGHNAVQTEYVLSQECLIFVLRAFAAAGDHHHENVEHFCEMRLAALRQNRFEKQQLGMFRRDVPD